MLTGEEPGGKPTTLLERAGDKASGIGQIGQGNPRLRLALQWGLAFLIFAFLVFFVVRQWNSIPEDFEWHFRPGWLLVAMFGVAGLYIFQGEIWRLMRARARRAPPAPPPGSRDLGEVARWRATCPPTP